MEHEKPPVKIKSKPGCRACRTGKKLSHSNLVCPATALTIAEAVSNIAEPFKEAAKPTKPPNYSNKDLLCVYPMGDPHLGMFAWRAETGEDFDLKMAERTLVAATDQLVNLAPPAEKALIINLGDFFHADNQSNQTTRSKNSLDVDTRWAKVLGVGVRVMRRIIDRALVKHQHVTVICEVGNHDDHSSIMLALCLAQYYTKEPRVHIDTSPAKFHWYHHGQCLIGVTHGDTIKPAQLPGIMANDRPMEWGRTIFRFWYTGHIHHDSAKEYPGCVVESFRTLAARDAWHSAHGYRSGRDMKCDVLHKKWGRITRHIVGIKQITEKSTKSLK